MQCLDMPARMFFSLLRNGRELKNKEVNFFLHELCDVSVCSNVQDYKYVRELKQIYRNKFLELKVKSNPREFDMDDPSDRKAAAGIFISFFKQKKKFEGLNG